MKIRDAVRPESVFLDLETNGDESVIATIARVLSKQSDLDSDMVGEALTERESLGSTSVGNGFAIPHCKLTDLEGIIVSLARFRDGVEFGDTKNNDPVSFFFVVLSPPDQPAEHLQVLSQIARILKSAELRQELLEAPDAASVVDAIDRAADREGL